MEFSLTMQYERLDKSLEQGNIAGGILKEALWTPESGEPPGYSFLYQGVGEGTPLIESLEQGNMIGGILKREEPIKLRRRGIMKI